MDPKLQTPNIGCKELILKKLSYAVTSSVLMQIVILTVFLFVVHFNIFSPAKSISASLSTFASVITWLFLLPFLSVIFAQSLICAKDYVLRTSCISTRIGNILSILSTRNVLLLFLHVSSGGFFVWVFLSLTGGKLSSLFIKCKHDGYCLNEECFYLVFSGIFVGLYYFVGIYVKERNILFPVISQKKLPQFKSNLFPLIKASQRSAVLPVIYYVIIYYFFGETIRNNVNSFVNVHKVDTPHSLFSIFYVWLFAALYIFNMKLMRFFFEIFLMEPIEFPVENAAEDQLRLSDAIRINNMPIIQHLACLDFFLLSENSKARRASLFAISHPGNHPHNWNLLIENILNTLNEYKQNMNELINSMLSAEDDEKEKVQEQATNQFVKNYNYGKMRNMSLQNFSSPIEFVTVSNAADTKLAETTERINSKIKQNLNKFVAGFKRRVGITFLFEEVPIANVKHLLSNGQTIIWTVQGLASLTAASLDEDKFGILQKDIPIILTSLVELKSCLEKLNRIPALARKSQRFDDHTNKMRQSITSAVKRSLYHIGHKFDGYLKDLPLNNEVLQYLNGILSQ